MSTVNNTSTGSLRCWVVASPLRHTDLGTAITASLRAAIVSGEIPAGERLIESDLAERFGVSRGPVRDALAELERTGLVELQARKGSFVRSLTADDVDEVYSLRIALESLAIGRAVGHGIGVDRLASLLDDLEAANRRTDRAAIGRADMALHRALVEGAQHRRLLDAWERLADQTLLMMTDLPMLDPDVQGPMGAHRAIVDHMAAGDGEAATAALVAHLEQARRAVLDQYDTER